jgi:L-cysteine/cystine lyase
MPDAEKLAAVREALPALSAGIYLATPEVGPLPSEVAAAMDEYAQRELRTGRGHPDDVEAGRERIDEARAGVAAILAADVDAVTLTHGATDALARAFTAMDFQPGDRLLAFGREEPSTTIARSIAERRSVAVNTVDPADGDDESVELVRSGITSSTRLVVVPHVLAATGARAPIEAIARVAHGAGAVVLVDGSQAVGAIPVTADETGADFYAIAGEKWLLGPEGIGALWASRSARQSSAAVVAGAELDEFHKPSVVGFARSCGWLSMYVGLPWIHARGTSLARAAAERLGLVEGVAVLTPADRLATVVVFRIAGWSAGPALDELGSRVFAIAGLVPSSDAIRIGAGFFTTEQEIERFAAAVELLAGHTPETLPPKPRLTILGQDGK